MELIDKQAVIDKAVEFELFGEKIEFVAVSEIEKMPPAEPRRGKWMTSYLDHEVMGVRPKILYCSECNQCIAYPTNFCPNCGSYNGGAE